MNENIWSVWNDEETVTFLCCGFSGNPFKINSIFGWNLDLWRVKQSAVRKANGQVGTGIVSIVHFSYCHILFECPNSECKCDALYSDHGKYTTVPQYIPHSVCIIKRLGCRLHILWTQLLHGCYCLLLVLPGDILVFNCWTVTHFLSHLGLSCIKRSRLPLSKTGYILSSEGKQWPSKCSVIS